MKLTYKMPKSFKLVCTVFIVFILSEQSKAQLSAVGSMYYQNQYLMNPAMAGIDEGIVSNIVYSKQMMDLPGAPMTKLMTLAYGNADKNVGLGLNLKVDNSGLINRTRLMGTYAYHLTLNENSLLRFGLSLGMMKERLSLSEINGSSNDVTLARFNDRPAFIDGDFGLSYEYKGFQAQAAVPNLKTFFRSDASNASNIVDRVTSMFSVGYKFESIASSEISLEPRITFNQIKGYNNLLDVGVNSSLRNDMISLMLMYHNTKSVSIGLGTKLFDNVLLNTVYRTRPVVLSGNSNGNIELGLSANLSKYKLNKKD